jgi:hypothetical protein
MNINARLRIDRGRSLIQLTVLCLCPLDSIWDFHFRRPGTLPYRKIIAIEDKAVLALISFQRKAKVEAPAWERLNFPCNLAS